MNAENPTKRIIEMMVEARPTKALVKPGCLNCERAVCDECGTENFEHDLDKMRDVHMTPGQRAAYNRIAAMAKQRVSGDLRIHVKAEINADGIAGSRFIEVLRLELNDDGSLTAVINWPESML